MYFDICMFYVASIKLEEVPRKDRCKMKYILQILINLTLLFLCCVLPEETSRDLKSNGNNFYIRKTAIVAYFSYLNIIAS